MELSEPDLPIIPFLHFYTTEYSPNRSLQLHRFLSTPVPSNHLRRPSVTRSPGIKRKLSTIGELNMSIQASNNEVLEQSDSSKNQNHFPYSPRHSSRFSAATSNQSKHDRHIKFQHTTAPRKSVFASATSPRDRKKSFTEKIAKSLFRAQSFASVDKTHKLQPSGNSNKESSIPELKRQISNNITGDPKNLNSLRLIISDGFGKEKGSEESDIQSPLLSPSSAKHDTNVPKSALRKRFDKECDEPAPVSLSNMFRRKSCHCTDCGGLSDFEKRHLNVVSLSKRTEMNYQKSLAKKHQPSLLMLEKGTHIQENLLSLQLETLDEDASAEAKFSSKLTGITARKKSQDSSHRFVPLANQLNCRRHTTRPEQIKLDKSGCYSPLISNSPTATGVIPLHEKSSQCSKDSEGLGDETFNIRIVAESPTRDGETNKAFNLKDCFGQVSPISLRPDIFENQANQLSHRSSLVSQQTSIGMNQAFVKEEKKFTKILTLKNSKKPGNVATHAQTPLAKQSSPIKQLQLSNMEKIVSIKRALTTRNRSNEVAIKGIYGLNRDSSQDKSLSRRQISISKAQKNDYQLSTTDTPVKTDPVILPDLTAKNHHPLRHKNLSLQIKKMPERIQLPFDSHSQKSARSLRVQESIDFTKGMRTERDAASPIHQSGKVLEALKFQEISKESSNNNNKKSLKGLKLGKIQMGNLMKIYKNKEKAA